MPAPQIVAETSIPNFLLKLWKLVEDEQFNNCILWDDTGFSFHVSEPYQFSKEILPLYFKHSNLNSFIRQLNMYGFRKVTNLEKGSMKAPIDQADSLEFQHPYFVRNHPELLQYIKRKVSNPRTSSSTTYNEGIVAFGDDADSIQAPPHVVHMAVTDGSVVDKSHITEATSTQHQQDQLKNLPQILDEVRSLREKQHQVDAKFNQMKKENQALWREVVHMRQTHLKQQDVVNKLIRFLLSLVQPSSRSASPSNGGSKRVCKRPMLAIGGVDSSMFEKLMEEAQSAKRVRVSSAGGSGVSAASFMEGLEQQLRGEGGQSPGAPKSHGPIIADVTNEMLDEDLGPVSNRLISSASPMVDLDTAASTPRQVSANTGGREETLPFNDPTLFSPGGLSPNTAAMYKQFSSPNPSTADMRLISSTGEDMSKIGVANEWTPGVGSDQPQFSDHIDFVQSDLDTLREFLMSDSFNLDQDSLNNLFNIAEESNNQNSSSAVNAGIIGNEMQVYKTPEILVPTSPDDNSGRSSVPYATTPTPSPSARSTPHSQPPTSTFQAPQFSPRPMPRTIETGFNVSQFMEEAATPPTSSVMNSPPLTTPISSPVFDGSRPMSKPSSGLGGGSSRGTSGRGDVVYQLNPTMVMQGKAFDLSKFKPCE